MIVGTAPVTRNFVELRGLGVVNACLFGVKLVAYSSGHMIINLQKWDGKTNYRLGLKEEYEESWDLRLSRYDSDSSGTKSRDYY